MSNLEKNVTEVVNKSNDESTNTSVDGSASFTSNTRMLRDKIFSTVKHNRSPDYGRVDRTHTEQNSYSGAPRTFKFGITKKGVENDLNLSVMNSNNVPPYVQKNLKKLISYHPDGVWCAEIPLIYR